MLASFQVTPLTSLKFGELVVKAGFPPGVVNIVSGGGKVFYHIPRFSESEHKKSIIVISTHIPLEHILANIRNSHGFNKMTYDAKSAFILAK
jgi:hypothetical protein